MLSSATVAFGQQRLIVIKALNGKTGKPLANQRLFVMAGKSREDVRLQEQSFEATTGADGNAVIKIGSDIQWIQVWADRRTLCQDKPNFQAFPIAAIAKTGDSSPNNCSKVAVKPTPGTLIVYARNSTLLEGMAW